MGMFAEPDESNSFLAPYAMILRDSLRHWTQKALLDFDADPATYAKTLYRAPFALMSHDTATDPVFNYANLTAQRLFELNWHDYTGMPSRLSAESVNREERARLLAQVRTHGYIDNYQGIRISSSGKRFKIDHAIVWNLLDEQQQICGQAAMFDAWEFL